MNPLHEYADQMQLVLALVAADDKVPEQRRQQARDVLQSISAAYAKCRVIAASERFTAKQRSR